jgi:hypothetical protein
MSDVPQTAADSWREAAEWVEHSLAEGNQALRFLPPVMELVSSYERAGEFWAHPLDWGLVMSLSPELEGNPHLLIWSDDDWPCYEIELRNGSDHPLVGWFCDGEAELQSALIEAMSRLQGFGAGSPAEHPPRQPPCE